MIKLLAIAGSGVLHVSLLIGLTAAGGGDLPDGRAPAVRFVVAVPVIASEVVSRPAEASRPADMSRPVEASQPPETSMIGALVTARKLAIPPQSAQPQVHAAETSPSLEVAAPLVPPPALTPARVPAPAPVPAAAVVPAAAAVPAPTPAVDAAPMPVAAAPAPGHGPAPASGAPNGVAAPATSFATPVALIASVEPEYPVEARRAGQEGRVVVKAFVDAAGAVARTEIEVSSGFAALDTAASAAVSSYRFRPEIRSGTAAASTILVPIRFALTGSIR